MTGYANAAGGQGGWSWQWDLRAVNGRGLDLRLRIPDWIEGLEQDLRNRLKAAIDRGNVTLSLRLGRDGAEGGVKLDGAALSATLAALKRIEVEAAEAFDLKLAPSRATDILVLCRQTGFVEASDDEGRALLAALGAGAGALIEAFNLSRAAEGEALTTLLAGQVDRIEELVAEAAEQVEARAAMLADKLKANLGRVMDNADSVDADRVAQELALIAVKSDVTEELDRLTAHIEAARSLLASGSPAGRKLDFLTQEFNREANTLCSKAQFRELTTIGLELKAVIDQLREQVQNVE